MGNKNTKRVDVDAQKERKVTRNQELKKANKELSCVLPQHQTKRTGAPDPAREVPENQERELQARHELAAHLRSIAPFNHRWSVTATISEGTYGVVFAVQDVKTKINGVIKVAKSGSGNSTTEWEGFLLERIFRQMASSSIVRVLDKGMLADQKGSGMEFIVLEKAEIPVQKFIEEAPNSRERRVRVLEIAMQMLKGVHDLHCLGLLHRDLKPDNMGIYSKEQPVALLFDLGMSRMYTDGEGSLRPPRSVVPFRGTPEWASGHAQKGREQSRFDDLIAWLYVIVELFSRKDTNQPLPWTYRTNPKVVSMLKSSNAPARNLLRECPTSFFTIHSYLQTANRQKPPQYDFLADQLKLGLEEVRKEPAEKQTATASGLRTDK